MRQMCPMAVLLLVSGTKVPQVRPKLTRRDGAHRQKP